MKLVMENWRRFLLLKESIDPKIMSMIDKAEKQKLRVKIKDSGNYGVVRLYSTTTKDPKYWEVGAVAWQKPDPNRGKCLDAMTVTSAQADFGYGPLIYDVAIEATGGLMSDRTEVSGEAEAVWRKYVSRGDVQGDQLDINKDFGEPQLTPDYIEDDCDQVPAHDRHGSDWHKSPLTKVIRKSGTPVMDELRKRGMLQE